MTLDKRKVNMQRFLHKFQNLSLIWQFTLVIFFILFIPTIIILVLYIQTFQNSLITQGKTLIQNDLNRLSNTMDTSFNMIDSSLAELVYQQEFSYFLNDRTDLTKREQNYFSMNLRSNAIKLRNLYSDYFKHIVVYSSNTQMPESFEYTYDFLYMERLQDTKYVSDIIDNPDILIYGKVRKPDYTYPNTLHNIEVKKLEYLVVPVYRKIFSINPRDLIGIIEIIVPLDKLIPVDTLTDLEAGVSYFLYDDTSGQLYPLHSMDAPPVIQSDFPENSGIVEGTLNGIPYYFAYDRRNKTEMVEITAISKKTLLQPAVSMKKKVLLIAILALPLIVSLSSLAIRILLRRLSEMGKMIRKIESGDFDIHVNENGSDEISKIARSFNQMGHRLQSTIQTLVQQEKLQKETELRALEAQINPHFLYNTLENMRMQCEIDEYYQIGDGLAALGDLFRYSIKWTEREIPFALEWKNLKNYLSIMQLRHESNLIYTLNYQNDSDEIDHIPVPKLILQPLVENCFHHGFRDKIPPFELSITASITEQELLIRIQDNGVGISKDRLLEIQSAFEKGTAIGQNQSHYSIGLSNVKQRIDMNCQSGSHLEIFSEENHGTNIHIHISL